LHESTIGQAITEINLFQEEVKKPPAEKQGAFHLPIGF